MFIGALPAVAQTQLQVGAAAIDITPQKFPVLINGGMTSNSAEGATTPIHARAIVLAHGSEKVAIVVVDSCMMSRQFLDDAKQLAAQSSGIPADRMLISATHAHSVPASMGCLGTNADETYVPFLRVKISEAIERAAANLEPARVGWAVVTPPTIRPFVSGFAAPIAWQKIHSAISPCGLICMQVATGMMLLAKLDRKTLTCRSFRFKQSMVDRSLFWPTSLCITSAVRNLSAPITLVDSARV